MTCDEWESMMQHEDELSDQQRALFAGHLNACAGCREKHEAWRQLLEAIAQAARVRPQQPNPGAFMTRTMAAIEGGPSASAISWIFTPVPKISLTLASIVLSLFLFTEQRIQQREKEPARPEAGQTRLDSRIFLKSADPLKPQKETIQQLTACATSQHCSNALVKNYKRKFNQN